MLHQPKKPGANRVKEQFLRLREKFCPTPGEFDHHFVSRGRGIRQKIAQVAGIRSLKKIFPRVAQLELTETLMKKKEKETHYKSACQVSYKGSQSLKEQHVVSYERVPTV